MRTITIDKNKDGTYDINTNASSIPNHFYGWTNTSQSYSTCYLSLSEAPTKKPGTIVKAVGEFDGYGRIYDFGFETITVESYEYLSENRFILNGDTYEFGLPR